MNIRKVGIIVVLLICIFSLVYAIYYQLSVVKDKGLIKYEPDDNYVPEKSEDIPDFETLFNNSIDYQGYENNVYNKADSTKELVYTTNTINKTLEEKYEIKVSIPTINANNSKISKINKEIKEIFEQKANSIIANSNKSNFQKTIYTVEYTACLNENILSLMIKANLKEGNNVQRLIVKTYAYNLSSNEEINLKNMLVIKNISESDAEKEIKNAVEEGISHANNLAELGYSIYNRDINSDMYKIENSNTFFIGKNNIIYVIYAYGNSNYTSEKDVAIIK